jgi:hypothetical protein
MHLTLAPASGATENITFVSVSSSPEQWKIGVSLLKKR